MLKNTREPSAHVEALRRFARRRGIAEESAVETYERERGRLAREAKVERYVGVLAEKRAKQALRRKKAGR